MSNQHQQFALQDPQPRAYKMDLQLPPPPRGQPPPFTTKNLPPQPPNSKSQDEWLRDCGHPSLHSFLEYYGFDPRDADDIAEGRNFLSQIRRQEQEQWEERQNRSQAIVQAQSQSQPPSQPQMRKGMVNNPELVRRSTANDATTSSFSRGNTPTMNIYGLRPFEMEEAERMSRMAGGVALGMQKTSPPQQQNQQIPRSSAASEGARFHNRVISDTVMNAYGIKPWEVEAAEGMRANLGSFGR